MNCDSCGAGSCSLDALTQWTPTRYGHSHFVATETQPSASSCVRLRHARRETPSCEHSSCGNGVHDLNVRAVNVGSDEMLSVSWTKITLKADPGHLENLWTTHEWRRGAGIALTIPDHSKEIDGSGSTNVSAQVKSSDWSDRITITGEKVRIHTSLTGRFFFFWLPLLCFVFYV